VAAGRVGETIDLQANIGKQLQADWLFEDCNCITDC
jgi:hypothetical protein